MLKLASRYTTPMPWVWRSRSVQSSAWISAEKKSAIIFSTRRVLISLRVMRLSIGVLLSLLHVGGGGDSAPSGYMAVRDNWKRREALGRTGKTAESSARKACMKLSVVVRRQKQSKERVVCCMVCMLGKGSAVAVLLTLQKKYKVIVLRYPSPPSKCGVQ